MSDSIDYCEACESCTFCHQNRYCYLFEQTLACANTGDCQGVKEALESLSLPEFARLLEQVHEGDTETQAAILKHVLTQYLRA